MPASHSPVPFSHLRPTLTVAAALCVAAPRLGAQLDLRREATAGSEAEAYLRILQVAGQVPLRPWSVRAFSPVELDGMAPDSAHPWAARLPARDSGAARLRWIRPETGLAWHSGFPGGGNDGPVWEGRGVTGRVSAGVELRAGPLTVRLEPLAFWAENRAFDLMAHSDTTRPPLADPDRPRTIDQPQRFGEDAYLRVDPGQSTVRLDGLGFAFGASTANQQWGPADQLPLVLGTHAGGFAHVFLGTSRPWNLGIGRAHGRVVWGSLDQTEYSSVTGHGSRRYMTGLVAAFTPRGADGLEVGVSRFFHNSWPRGGLRAKDLLQPLQPFAKADLDSTSLGGDERWLPDNQIASVFARWVLPRTGAEFWGEYVRNDHSWDFQDFLLEPDHEAGYVLGARKVWRRTDRLTSLSAEWLDTQTSHLLTVRRQGTLYAHGHQRQGHTQRGQLLGSPAAFGGGGLIVALESYTPAGRWRVDLTRTRVRGGPPEEPARVGVRQSLGGELTAFRGGVDWTAGLRATHELNRNFQGDAWDFSASVGARLGF